MSDRRESNGKAVAPGPRTAPDRPRLRPGAQVFKVTADRVQIAFANYTATFHGVEIVQGILSLVVALDGHLDRAEAVGVAATETGLDPGFLGYVLELLSNSWCLYAETEDTGAKTERSSLREFYATQGEDPVRSLAALSSAHPLIVFPASTRGEMAAALGEAGIEAAPVAIPPGSSCEEALAEVESGLHRSAGPLVSWGFPYRIPFVGLLNGLAIERGIPALFGGCEGVVGRIGPYLIPRNTACLECYNRRILSNSGEFEMVAYDSYRSCFMNVIPAPWPAHPVFHDAILRLFVIELTQICRGLPPQTIGGVIEHTFGGGVSQRLPVYKVPRCPGCGPVRPRRAAWDAKLPAPLVKEGGE